MIEHRTNTPMTRRELANELDDIATTMRLRELPRRTMGYRPRYTLTIEAPPDHRPPVVRLRPVHRQVGYTMRNIH